MQFKTFFLILFLAVSFQGCTTVQRTDKEIIGNAGYIEGTKEIEESIGDEKETRTILGSSGSGGSFNVWRGIMNIDRWIRKNLW